MFVHVFYEIALSPLK